MSQHEHTKQESKQYDVVGGFGYSVSLCSRALGSVSTLLLKPRLKDNPIYRKTDATFVRLSAPANR